MVVFNVGTHQTLTLTLILTCTSPNHKQARITKQAIHRIHKAWSEHGVEAGQDRRKEYSFVLSYLASTPCSLQAL